MARTRLARQYPRSIEAVRALRGAASGAARISRPASRLPAPAAARLAPPPIAAQVPLRRLATPADHAQVMLFLASDGAAFLNGTVQDVNGGRVMM